jgi:acetoacetate decarboxylase
MAVRYAARTPEQIRSREVEKTSIGAWSTVLVATFETDPAILASVLPRPLEPSSTPLAKVTFASVDIPGLTTFGAGSVSVQCSHEGTLGYYCLVMPMSTEQSVIGGRETFGEPKKLGQVAVELEGDSVHGTMARMGVTFAEFTGHTTDTLETPAPETRTDFYFKLRMARASMPIPASSTAVERRPFGGPRRAKVSSNCATQGSIPWQTSQSSPSSE